LDASLAEDSQALAISNWQEPEQLSTGDAAFIENDLDTAPDGLSMLTVLLVQPQFACPAWLQCKKI
jgi:hypothetical protein